MRFNLLPLVFVLTVTGCANTPAKEVATEKAPSRFRIQQKNFGINPQFVTCKVGEDCAEVTPKTRFVPPPPPPPAPAIAPMTAPAEPKVVEETVVIHFAFGQSRLDRRAKRTLDAVAVKASTGKRIRIEGRTDNIGSEHINDRLAARRAQVVRSYLINQGVAKEIIVEAEGKCCYTAENSTRAGRAKNRRAIVTVTSTQQPEETRDAAAKQ